MRPQNMVMAKVGVALLGAGAAVNQATSDGFTPLSISAQHGHVEVVQVLLDANAAVNQANETGESPLFIAVNGGHVDVIQVLLGAGAAVNQARNDGLAPLNLAAHNGHGEIVVVLLAAGAIVNQAMENEVTPLYMAAQSGHGDVVQVLLGAGAAVNQARNDGVTPLWVSAAQGHVDVVQALLSAGAVVNQARADGLTPLYMAALSGHADVMKLLISSGVPAGVYKSEEIIEWVQKSDIIGKLGDIDACIQCYACLVTISPNRALFHNNLSCYYHIKGQVTLAEIHFKESIALRSTAGIHCEYGLFLFNQLRYQDAVVQLTKSIDNKSDVDDGLNYGPLERPCFESLLLQKEITQVNDLIIKRPFPQQFLHDIPRFHPTRV